MEFFKKFLTAKFLIIFFAVGSIIALIAMGSDMPDEIKPGDGFSQASIGINVMANNDVWIDSGVSISADTKDFKFTISDSIFLCSGSDNGAFVPYEKKNVPVNANNSNYVDTGISVSNGDYVKFSLVPISKDIKNCGVISTNKDFIFDKDDTFYDRYGNKKVKAADICRGEDFYLENSKEDKDKIVGTPYSTSQYIKNFDDLDNYASNRWRRGGQDTWIKGSFYDFRYKTPDNDKIDKLNADCSNLNSNGEFKKLQSELLNEKCNRYARQGGQIFSYYQKKNGNASALDSDGLAIEMAEGLVGAILNSNDDSVQCFPTGVNSSNCRNVANYTTGNIENYSLRTNYQYKIENPVILNQRLVLGIADNSLYYPTNIGGYNVEVRHSCVKDDGENLYMYIGDLPPAQADGFIDAIHIGPGVQGGVYKLDSNGRKGKLFFKIKDNMDGLGGSENYGNNGGKYQLSFRVNASPTWISEIVSRIVDPLRSIIFTKQTVLATGEVVDSGASFDLYHGIMNSGLRNIIRALLVLFVAIIGIGFTLGILDLKANDMFMILFKIGAVSILLTDMSWYFLNKYFLNIFWYGPDVLINKFTMFYNQDGMGSVKYNASFGFLDKTLGTLFQWENLTKWISLLPYSITNPLSLFLFVMLFWSFWDIIQASVKGIILYSVCIVINGFLVGLAPIFFCFLLFKITFRFFDTWVKQLIGNMMTIVLYFVVIGMMNEIIYNLLYQIFNFGAYKECMLPISFGDTWKACFIHFPMPFVGSALANFSSNGASSAEAIAHMLPISIPVIIVFKIFTKCYHIMVDVTNVLPSSIFGGSMMYNALEIADSASQGALYGVGMDKESIGRRERASKEMKKGNKTRSHKRADYAPKSSLSSDDGSSNVSGNSGLQIPPTSLSSTSSTSAGSDASGHLIPPTSASSSTSDTDKNSDFKVDADASTDQPSPDLGTDSSYKVDLSTKELNQYKGGIIENPYDASSQYGVHNLGPDGTPNAEGDRYGGYDGSDSSSSGEPEGKSGSSTSRASRGGAPGGRKGDDE